VGVGTNGVLAVTVGIDETVIAGVVMEGVTILRAVASPKFVVSTVSIRTTAGEAEGVGTLPLILTDLRMQTQENGVRNVSNSYLQEQEAGKKPDNAKKIEKKRGTDYV
jgi:hypothetical protein